MKTNRKQMEKEGEIPLYTVQDSWLNGNGEMVCTVLLDGQEDVIRLADPKKVAKAARFVVNHPREFFRS